MTPTTAAPHLPGRCGPRRARAGYAADDYAALHFRGGEFVEAVALREGAQGYRVEPGAETALGTRIL